MVDNGSCSEVGRPRTVLALSSVAGSRGWTRFLPIEKARMCDEMNVNEIRNNVENGAGLNNEGSSHGRDIVGQQALSNCNQRTARIKWRKEVNVVIMECHDYK